jgi:hypothetical protein
MHRSHETSSLDIVLVVASLPWFHRDRNRQEVMGAVRESRHFGRCVVRVLELRSTFSRPAWSTFSSKIASNIVANVRGGAVTLLPGIEFIWFLPEEGATAIHIIEPAMRSLAIRRLGTLVLRLPAIFTA